MADLRPCLPDEAPGEKNCREIGFPELCRRQGLYERCHIAREGRRKAQQFAAEGVLKTEQPRVQGLAAKVFKACREAGESRFWLAEKPLP